MIINKITIGKNNSYVSKNLEKKPVLFSNNNNISLNGLQTLGIYKQINFKGIDKKFDIALSSEELAMRTSDDVNTNYKLLDVDSPHFINLREEDKKALAHLVKAAVILDDVSLKQDNPRNIEFKKYL